MKRNTIYAFLLTLALVFSGCGSNDIVDSINNGQVSGDSNTTTPIVPVVDGDYNFYNIPSSIIVDKAATEYPFAVQLIDSETEGIAGATVTFLANDTNYGKLAQYSVTTDEGGFANFTYISPASLASIDGQPYPLTAIVKDENGTRVDSANITLSFNASSTTPTAYHFYNAKNIIVREASETQEITVDLLDSENHGVPGKKVKITTPHLDFGTVTPATATTDAAGKAVFSYTAPADLSKENGNSTNVTFSFTDDNNNAIAPATANIAIESGSIISTFYEFRYPTTPIKITRADESRTISVYVTNEDGVGIEGEQVTASVPEFGKLDSSAAITDASGRADFSYTAPAPTKFENNNTVITLRNKNIQDDVPITIITEAVKIESDYNLTNANDITVHYSGEQKEIAVQLVRAGIPIVGESVIAKEIDVKFGRVKNATVTTGADGYARFNFIAADIFPDTNTSIELVHFTDTNGAEVTTSVDINFDEKPLYAFENTSNITVTHGSQKEDIKTQLTYKGIPVAGKTVNMLAFSEGNGTIVNGYSVVTDSVGYATFFYMAPETLDEVNGTTLNLTMQYDEGATHLETKASILFSETTDNVEGNVSLPIVVIPTNQREIILESNSKTVEIPISVFKDIAPYTSGSVKVELPNKVLNGVDVGQFDSYEVAVNAQGIATFSYTGPSNLQALISNDDNDSTFRFYHVENSADKQDMKVLYQLPADPHISRNYSVDITTTGEFSMLPEDEKSFNVLLKAMDSTGNDVALEDENITKITVLTTNSAIAQILDTANDTLVNTLDLNPVNNSPFTLRSKKLSGLVPLQVTIEFRDANGKMHLVSGGDFLAESKIVNVRVLPGPPSAISISYVSTGQDVERAKYIETLAISVTDEYGNKVNSRPNISLGAIVGYAVDGAETSGIETNETKRLFYGRDDIMLGVADGTISDPDATNKATFSDPILSDVFKYVNAEGNNTDKLVIFGERKNYEAMGKWDVKAGISPNTLNLVDDYYGIKRPGLYYAVGHNYYQDMCRQDGREWIGTTGSETYQLDEEGTVTVTYKYDYHLTGKDALIWVNLDGIQSYPDGTSKKIRVGETVKHTLRGAGFAHIPSGGYSLKKGVGGVTVTFDIWHENAPERYRNGHFGWRIKEGSNCSIDRDINGNRIMYSTNDYDARSCIGGDGHAFVTMQISNPDPDSDCTFDISGVVVSSEF